MPDTMMTNEQMMPRNRSVDIKDLAAALVKAQAVMDGAKKDAEAVVTGNTKRTYADLASVWDAVRKPLTDNGLCVVQFPRTVGQGVEIETTLLHGATGQFMSDVLWVPCGKNDAQGLGSAITYGRRYALMAVVGVCPVDDDGAAATQGVPGSAGGGGDFRPPGPRRQMPAQSSANGRSMAQQEPQLVDHNRPKGALPATKPAAATGQTKEEQRAAKLREATDKRINALKSVTGWTRATLDQFWEDNKTWIEWMADPANEALAEYERFSNAFADAEVNMRETA